MEGYFNVSGSHNAFDDFDIEGKKSFDKVEKKANNFNSKGGSKNNSEGNLNDKERLLGLKVDLDNGGQGYVFSVSGTGYNAQWKCHVCDMVFMGIKNLLFHERSMNHSALMQASKHAAVQFTRIEIEEGEPAPPGVDEDEEADPPPPTNIQSTLDDFKSTPLIGLEYVVELNDAYEKESTYVCMLCDKKGDPRTVMAHLVSYNHRLKYLERHFPITYNAINSLPKTVGARKGLAEIVLRISNEMEEKLGRLRPVATDARHFEDNRFNLMCTINKSKHFIETPDSTFVHLVDRELLIAAAMKPDDQPKIIINIPKPDTTPKVAPPKAAPPTDTAKPEKDKEEDDEIEFQGAFIKGTRVPLTRQLRVRKFSMEAEDKNNAGGSKADGKSAATDPKKDDDAKSMCSLSSISSASSSLSPSPKDSLKRRRSLSRSRSRSRSGSRARRRARRSRSRSRSRSKGRYRRSRSRSLSRGRRSWSPYRRQRGRSPRNNYKREDSRDDKKRQKDRADDLQQERVKWEKFREEVAVVEKEMLEVLSGHEKNPEKHPKYPEEWKLFWNKRYKELQVSGKDPAKHDFKPEWIEFWNRRMRELHEQDFAKRREELREKLGLPADEAKPHFNRRKKFVTGPDGRPRSRSPSPWEEGSGGGGGGGGSGGGGGGGGGGNFPRDRERERERERDLRNRDRERELDRDFPYRGGVPPPRTDWRDRPTSINVLRILTALEQQLGSLGPRVNGVLSEAIALEKVAHGHSDSLLRDTQIVVLFETVKEKFRGQLLAGIVERNMVTATRNAINAVSDLLYAMPTLLENAPKVPSPKALAPKPEPTVIHVPTPPVPSVAPKLPAAPKPVAAKLPAPAAAPAVAPDPVCVPGVGDVDRMAIAKEIATALVMQGKTDVSQEELEQLVNAVVGMAQAKAAAPAPAPVVAPAAAVPVAPVAPAATAAAAPAVAAPPAATPVTVSADAPKHTPEITGLQLLQSAYDADESKNAAAAPQEKAPAPSMKRVDLFGLDSLVPQPAARKKSPAKSAAEVAAQTAAQAVDAFVDELTETDLRLLLQSFKDLPLDEQHGLIRYLKKLEATDPVRVEKLRKYVNLGSAPAAPSTNVVPPEKLQALAKVGQSGRLSPFSSRHGSRNPTQSEPKRPALKLDSDSDDDYSFDDVCKAAKKKVSEQEAAEAAKRKIIEEREEAKRRQEEEAMNKRIQEEKAKAEQAIKELEDREREQRRIIKEKERQEREVAMNMGAANWNALNSNKSNVAGQNPSIPPPPVPPPGPLPMNNVYGAGYGDMSMGNFNGGNSFYPNSFDNQFQPRDGYGQQGGYFPGQQNNANMFQQAPQFNAQPGYPPFGNNPMYPQQPPAQQGWNQYY